MKQMSKTPDELIQDAEHALQTGSVDAMAHAGMALEDAEDDPNTSDADVDRLADEDEKLYEAATDVLESEGAFDGTADEDGIDGEDGFDGEQVA